MATERQKHPSGGVARLREAWRSRWAEELRFAVLYVPICMMPFAFTVLWTEFGLLGLRLPALNQLMAVSSLCMLGLAYQLYKKNLDAEAQRQLLVRIARVDSLTGLGNRRALWEVMRREVGRARRTGQELSVVLVDLDGFKAVNDRLGHAGGDRLLKLFARVLLRHTREHQDALFRIGGDEFLVILPATDAPGAVEVAERIHAAFAEAGPTVANGMATGCSMGVAALGLDESAEEWLGRADAAMYEVKAAGGGVVLATESHATPAAGTPRPLVLQAVR